METEKIKAFLVEISPFNLLSQSQRELVAVNIEVVAFLKDTMLYRQDETAIHHLHIIKKGSVRLVDDHSQELYDLLTEGECFGGVTMLMKKSIPFRTMYTHEDSIFYNLSEEIFIQLCDQNKLFYYYFTNTLSLTLKKLERRNDSHNREITYQQADLNLYYQTLDMFGDNQPLFCNKNLSIQEAAQVMTQKESSYLLVSDKENNHIGIITDIDLKKKVVSRGMDVKTPVFEIMSSPLKTISHSASRLEGLMTMLTENRHHLVVSKNGTVSAVVTHDDFIAQQGISPISLSKQIEKAERIKDLERIYKKIPTIVQSLIISGLLPEAISGIISALNDNLIRKVVQIAENSMETPVPVDYCFFLLGSGGRKEQTFRTDQDNAIIREKSPAAKSSQVKAWFAELSTRICFWLNQVGFPFCKGQVMCNNPEWNTTAEKWQSHFERWITAPKPKEILNATVFFDLRGIYGKKHLVDDLTAYLHNLLKPGAPIFLANLAQACVKSSTPLSFFRTFVVQKNGAHKSKLDLKENGCAIITDIARIYALKNSIIETNTVARLRQSARFYPNRQQTFEDLIQAYTCLMSLRLNQQIKATRINETPDNYLNPSQIGLLDKKMLKESFQIISQFQDRVINEFSPGGVR